MMGSLVVPPHSLYKFPVNICSIQKSGRRKKNRKSRDVYSRQDCPEDFWQSHIRRHNSSLNLIEECINHNVSFLSSKVGHFSSLENLSSKVYNERRDARYYVQEAAEETRSQETARPAEDLSSREGKSFRKLLSRKSKTSSSERRKVFLPRKSGSHVVPRVSECQQFCQVIKK